MLVLGLDLETSGLEAKKDRIIEIGVVLWCTASHRPIQVYSDLIHWDDLQISEEVTNITGITTEDIQTYGVSLVAALEKVKTIAKHADYIVAHNGNEFDKKFMEEAWAQYSDTSISLSWIDTLTDLSYPSKITSRKLNHLAADHGFLNPFAHRAIFDVLTMLEILSKYDINEVVKMAASPTCRIYAKVSFEQKDLAKKEGFRWDAQARVWFKDIKEVHLVDTKFPFEIYRNS
jgi:DNA polymerase III alpha subunit (gram-positive type)